VGLAEGALECTLTPGDVLYIPPCWWHLVEALEGNISVLLPFDLTVAEQRVMRRPWTEASWGRQSHAGAAAGAAASAVHAPAGPSLAGELSV
jgi:hypothetical protein